MMHANARPRRKSKAERRKRPADMPRRKPDYLIPMAVVVVVAMLLIISARCIP